MENTSFEYQYKDKRLEIRISEELVAAATKSAQKRSLNRLAFIRAALENHLYDLQSGQLKKIVSNYEACSQGRKLSIRLSSKLHEKFTKVAIKANRGLNELIREAIERAL